MYYNFETKEDVKCKTEIFFVVIAYFRLCVHKSLNVYLGMFSDWNECPYGESDWSLAIYVEVFDWLAVSGTPAPPGMDVQDF